MKKEEKRGKTISRKRGFPIKKRKKEEKRGVLFSVFETTRNVQAEVKLTAC